MFVEWRCLRIIGSTGKLIRFLRSLSRSSPAIRRYLRTSHKKVRDVAGEYGHKQRRAHEFEEGCECEAFKWSHAEGGVSAR